MQYQFPEAFFTTFIVQISHQLLGHQYEKKTHKNRYPEPTCYVNNLITYRNYTYYIARVPSSHPGYLPKKKKNMRVSFK